LKNKPSANIGDGFVDIIAHFHNGKFVVSKEGALTTQLLIDDLANIINDIPNGQTARLLSCNDLDAARQLSQLTNKPFYASDGWVDLYANGEVRSQNAFHKFEGGQQGAAITHQAGEISGVNKLRLGSMKKWRSVEEIRDDVIAWATTYGGQLPTPTQFDKFNKATAASYRKTDGTIETVYGRNGVILNTQASFPTISAEKGLGLHPDYKCDIKTHKLSKPLQGNLIEFQFGCIYSNDREKKEFTLHAETGEPEWKVDYSTYIRQDYPQFDVMARHENQLVCLANEDCFLGIDIDNGEIKWEETTFSAITGKPLELARFSGLKENVIAFCSGAIYAEFDLIRKKYIPKKTFAPLNDLLSAEIYIQRTFLQNNLLYFTSQNNKTKKWHTVGILDTKTLEMLWIHELELPHNVFLNHIPLADEAHLYIKDSNNTLHIFEKNMSRVN